MEVLRNRRVRDPLGSDLELTQETIDIGSLRDLPPLEGRNDAKTLELSLVPFAQVDTDRALFFTFFNIGFSKFIHHLVHISLARE
jgi:hypothetical protein